MQWLTNILCGADFEESAESVLEFVAEKCHAQAAFLYLFSRRKGAFELHRGWARGGTSVPTAAIFDRKIDVDATSGAVGRVLLNGCVQRESADDTELVRACVQELFRRRFVDNFFKAIRTPVDFSDADHYFRKTAELLSDALAMDLVAIRSLAQRGDSSDLDQTQLITDAFYSYRDPQLTDDVSFDGELPAPFVEAIGAAKEALKSNGAQTAQYEIVNPSDPRFSFLSRAKILRNIRCFAIFPILSKDYEGKPYVYGLISCASESISSFSDLHRNAVETSMQLIGVAISNHLSYREVRRLTSNVYEQIFSATALDLAQSAKHQLDNIGHELSLARRRLVLIKPRPGHEKRTREIADSLQKVEGAITDATRRLKFNASSVPKLSEKPVAVLDVWNDAVYLMSGRLEAAGIKVTATPPSSGGGFNDYFYVDWLKEAFLNLLGNSLNAFSDRPKHNRWIRIDLRDDYEKATHYRFDYSDSAGGLITTKIQVPEAVRLDNPTLRLQELIFLPKVSSRKGNGVSVGWGLYLVRQAINGVHHGSVRCSNGKDGCIFEFEIPKHLDKRA